MVIGIDLGTTNSAAAFLEQEQPTVIPNDRGNRITPSMVAVTGSGELLVGEAAKNQAMINPGGTAIAVKRSMGSTSPLKLGNREMLPEVVSAEILRKLKSDAEAYLGEEIKEAVITVPAYFTEPQRRKTKEAGHLAGLRISRIINEPTAAALAYASSCGKSRNIMVYDLGGGTFDVTILSSSDGHFRVLSSCGDNKLGGIDFDQLLFQEVVRDFSRRAPSVDFEGDQTLRQQLMEQVERAKIELSSRESASISLPFIGGGASPLHLSFEIRRNRFNELIRPFIEKTVSLCRQAMDDAKVRPDTLILSGGSSRIPLVKSLLGELTGLRPENRINPEEVVALGAAVHAGMIQDGRKSLFHDVTPLPLGVEIEGGNVVTILEKNSPLPAVGKQHFTTICDGQRSVEIHVLQGNNKRVEANTSLGRFLLGGIRNGCKGEPLIEVSFRVDEDGILHALARDVDTGSLQQVTISREPNPSPVSGNFETGVRDKVLRLVDRVKQGRRRAGNGIDSSFHKEISEILLAAAKACEGNGGKELNSCRIALETVLGEIEAILRDQELKYG